MVEAQRRYCDVELVDDPELADVLACHATMPPAWSQRYPGKPLVAHCHGLYWAEYGWPDWALKANADVMELLRQADVITAPSEWVAQAIRRHTYRPVIVVPHGVDSRQWQPPEQPGSYLLWNKSRPDAVCDPEPLRDLMALLPDMQLVTTFWPDNSPPPNVTVTGRLPAVEAAQLVRGAGTYLSTTRETFGIGTLEAMACGVPVAGWRWGGQAELFGEGDGVLLSPPGDIESLAADIHRIVAERPTFSAAARSCAERFSWDGPARTYDDIYWSFVTDGGPTVSVIVTAYSLAEYLPACLDSVAKQAGVDWECIIVDDASPDACGRIADEYAARDDRFRVIHNEQNLYLARARNVGMAASSGRYLLPLDADDRLPMNALALLAAALDRDRRLDIAYGNVRFVEPDGHEWHSGWPLPFDLYRQLDGPGQLLPYSSMFRRRVWEHLGGYRSRCRSSEDLDFWLRATSYGYRAARVTEADTLLYSNRPDSMSRVEGWREHRAWYPWVAQRELLPAGAATPKQRPIPSLDPAAVSVIIPIGPGHGRYLLDAVDSVDAQTFRRWECIVVDDSGEELPTLPPWVRLLRTRQPGSGPAAARNIGLRAARGEVYLPLDADDYLEPEALALLTEAWRGSPADIVYCDFWEDPQESGQFSRYNTPEYDADLLVRGGSIHPVTAMTPVALARELGGYNESLSAWEDWAFQLEAAARGHCSERLPVPLFTYRKHTGRRREENIAAYDRSKADILRLYSDYFARRKALMACSKCGQKRTPPTPAAAPSSSSEPGSDGPAAALVEYTGAALGRQTYRVNGRIYRFGGSQRRGYVAAGDLEFFLQRDEFRAVVTGMATAIERDAPILVAEGPPPPPEQPIKRGRGRPRKVVATA